LLESNVLLLLWLAMTLFVWLVERLTDHNKEANAPILHLKTEVFVRPLTWNLRKNSHNSFNVWGSSSLFLSIRLAEEVP
jgi:hypothetical protein